MAVYEGAGLILANVALMLRFLPILCFMRFLKHEIEELLAGYWACLWAVAVAAVGVGHFLPVASTRSGLRA